MTLRLALALFEPWLVNGIRYQVVDEDTISGLPRFRAKLWDSGAQLGGGIDGMSRDSFAVKGASPEHRPIFEALAVRLRDLDAFS